MVSDDKKLKAQLIEELGAARHRISELEALGSARVVDEDQSPCEDPIEPNAELAVISSVQEGLASKLDIRSIYELVGKRISEIFDRRTFTRSSSRW
jgi:hypothetical protein